MTTRAVNEKRRPPRTTLATRLMVMTRDSRSPPTSVGSSRVWVVPYAMVKLLSAMRATERQRRSDDKRPAWPGNAMNGHLELQTCVSCGRGEGGDPTVIEEAATVEHDPLHARGAGPLGDERTEARGRVDRAAGTGGALVGFRRRRRGQRAARVVVDDLGHEVPVRAVHGEARTLRRAVQLLAYPAVAADAAAAAGLGDVSHDYFFPAFPALRSTRSPW